MVDKSLIFKQMKRLLTILAMLIPFVSAMGQGIIIDARSLSVIGTTSDGDIEEISQDSSSRDCARIIMSISRMTRADMEDITVHTDSSDTQITKMKVSKEGYLIIELTAEMPTTLYLYHDTYGTSNEVSLNLEGGNEYYLSAKLDASFSISLSTYTIYANVYIDNSYVGYTDLDGYCYINYVPTGKHEVTIYNNGNYQEYTIEVDSYTKQFTLIESYEVEKFHFVTFEVTPKNAVVDINGDKYTPNVYGIVTAKLLNGRYHYEVSADDYTTLEDSFTIDGEHMEFKVDLAPSHGWLTINGSAELRDASIYIDNVFVGKGCLAEHKLSCGEHKVKISRPLYLPYETTVVISGQEIFILNPTLTVNYANITLTTVEGADIYVNNKKVGRGNWSGDLETGSYLFEARKDKHYSTKLRKTITTEQQKQIIALEAPRPITGSVKVSCKPANCAIKINNTYVGQAPLTTDLIIGSHTVTASIPGYTSDSTIISVSPGQTVDVCLRLTKKNKHSGINVGISAGYGWERYTTTTEERYDYNSSSDIVKESTTLDFGATLRLFKYNSIMNIVTGIHFICDDDYIYTSIPLSFNFPLFTGHCVPYFGFGTEFTTSARKNVPIILQTGLACRYSDFCLYFKSYPVIENHFDECDIINSLSRYGFRYTYFF